MSQYPPSSSKSGQASTSSSSSSSSSPSSSSKVHLNDGPPATRPAETSLASRQVRARASTSPERHSAPKSAGFTDRRRANTNLQARQPPPPLDITRYSATPDYQKPLQTVEEAPPSGRSAPIPIPPRKKDPLAFSPTGTPLTAREPKPKYFGAAVNQRPHISESLTPEYSFSGSKKKMSNNQSETHVQRGFAPPPPRAAAALYTPTSPLSPTSAARKPSGNSHQKDKRPTGSLNLSGLPKYHPANFPSKDSCANSSQSVPSRGITSQPRPARGSDAQQKLHQYQRDLVANAGKYAKPSKPSSPRLTPMRSPGEPMTPLMLEAKGDYILAGSGSLQSGFKGADKREIVERLVHRENERRNHPEARSGSVSPAMSPAASPAA